ncbi:MAG: hypothetical protein QMC80_08520 [Thermoplasmatales archaeon]|nr:hypothetical protein [Thermoplasmatales archaeon]
MGATPEIRRLIVRARKSGKRVKEIAEMFNMSHWTVLAVNKACTSQRGVKASKINPGDRTLFIER